MENNEFLKDLLNGGEKQPERPCPPSLTEECPMLTTELPNTGTVICPSCGREFQGKNITF